MEMQCGHFLPRFQSVFGQKIDLFGFDRGQLYRGYVLNVTLILYITSVYVSKNLLEKERKNNKSI